MNKLELQVGDIISSPKFAFGYLYQVGKVVVWVDGITTIHPLLHTPTQSTIDVGRFDPSRSHAKFVIEEIDASNNNVIITAIRLFDDRYELDSEVIKFSYNVIDDVTVVGRCTISSRKINWFEVIPS